MSMREGKVWKFAENKMIFCSQEMKVLTEISLMMAGF